MKTAVRQIGSAAVFFVVWCVLISGACGETVSNDEAIADLIAALKPSIVAVGTYYFNDKPKAGLAGTGFAISGGRKIVTNYHVVSGIIEKNKEPYLRIFHRLFDAKGIQARIIGIDRFHDLAILEHTGRPLPALEIAPEGSAREGHRVLFSGYPIGMVLGLHMTTHFGRISAIAPLVQPSPSARIIDGELIRHLDNPYEVFQIDAAAFPGNSGSPVVRVSTGEVIGVINQVFVKGKKEHALTRPSGITYAIPARYIRELEHNMTKKD